MQEGYAHQRAEYGLVVADNFKFDAIIIFEVEPFPGLVVGVIVGLKARLAYLYLGGVDIFDQNTDMGGWWAQMVTVAYERIRGLREKGQRRGGNFDVNKSKTIPVPIAKLYDAFGARKRKRWLGDHPWDVSTSTREKSIRAKWADGTRVDVYFWERGEEKAQVQLQHRGLPTKKEADEVRAFWTEKLGELHGVLTE